MAGILEGITGALSANPFGIAAGAYGIGRGIFQGIKARKLERQNIRPIARVNSNLVKNVGDAAISAQTGLADRVYNNALTQLNTGLSVGARQIGRMGNSASVASTLRAYNQGINNLAAQDQQAQMQNQRGLMNARTALAGEEQRVWNWNEANKYQEMSQRIAQLRGAGQKNVFGGLTTLATLTQENPYDNTQNSYSTFSNPYQNYNQLSAPQLRLR